MKLTWLSAFLFVAIMGGCTDSDSGLPKQSSEINQSSEQDIGTDILARRQLTRKALDELKGQSLFSDDVDWDIINEELEMQIANIQTEEDMKRPLNTALNHLRDPHARFYYKDQMFAQFTDWGNERNRISLPIDQDAMRRFRMEHDHHFELVGDQSGYIKISGIGPSKDVNEQAKFIRSNLEELSANGAKNWIIDLRYNWGGNMHPMMSGLGPLLCDGRVGGEANMKGEIIGSWTMNSANFYLRDYNDISLPASKDIPCDADVAVLISRYTVSSGEAVATTFKGRPNTAFFGEPTGGLTTTTNWEPIEEELFMSIAVSYYADRNNNVFKKNLQPDEPIEFSPELALSLDPAIIAAQNWLSKQAAE